MSTEAGTARVWDNVKDPGPEPLEPGPEPPMANREARGAWLDRTSKYRIWLRDYRRFQLANAMRSLAGELEGQTASRPEALVAFHVGAMVLAGEFDGGLFGGGLF